MISMNLKEYVKYQLDSLVSMIYDSCMQKHQIFNQIAVKAEEIYQQNMQRSKDGTILEESLHQLKVMLQYINQDISAHIDLALQQLSVNKRIQLQSAPKVNQEEEEEDQHMLLEQELTNIGGDSKVSNHKKIAGLLSNNSASCNFLSNAKHFDSTLSSLNAQFNQEKQIESTAGGLVGSTASAAGDDEDEDDDQHAYNTRANKGRLQPQVVITTKTQSLGNNSSNLKSILVNGKSKYNNNKSSIVQTQAVNSESQQQQASSESLFSQLLRDSANIQQAAQRQVSSELKESQGKIDQEWQPSQKITNKVNKQQQRSALLSQTQSSSNKTSNAAQSGKGSNLNSAQIQEGKNKMKEKLKVKKQHAFTKNLLDCNEPIDPKAFQNYMKELTQFEEKYHIKATPQFQNKEFFYFRNGKQGVPVIRYLADEDKEFVVQVTKALGVQKRCSELLRISFQQVSRVLQLQEIANQARNGKNTAEKEDEGLEKQGMKQKKKGIIDDDSDEEDENSEEGEVEEEEDDDDDDSEMEENEEKESLSNEQTEEKTVEKRKRRRDRVVIQPMVKEEQSEEKQIQEKDMEEEVTNKSSQKDKQKDNKQSRQMVTGLSGLKKMIRFPAGATYLKEEDKSTITSQNQKNQNGQK